jgi:adenosylmethionine-8-amino-7-oxononanoate aminotransferase
VAAAAGLASVREIVERKLPENARAMGAYLVQKLEALRPLGIVGDIRGKGLMLGVELVADPATKRPFPPETQLGLRIGKRALANGLLLRFDPHWFAFGPPLIVTEADIDQMVDILELSMREVLREV